MNWAAKWMTHALPFTIFALLPLILPFYFGFKLLRRIKSCLSVTQQVAGKVVLITGASSGIGEHLAYEYGKRGARLAVAARREDRLQAVAGKAKELGCPDVLVIRADVSDPQDCKRLVDRTVLHFGQLDYLVNNAGILKTTMFQDCSVSGFVPVMDINFWGAVHCAHAAIPHLSKTKGKIVVISSVVCWLPTPKFSFYNASKAALTIFFETLRNEYASQIGITIVTPGAIHSEITSNHEFLSEFGMDTKALEATEVCAKAIVESGCRGDNYLTVPAHDIVFFVLKIVFPELLDWVLRYHIFHKNKAN